MTVDASRTSSESGLDVVRGELGWTVELPCLGWTLGCEQTGQQTFPLWSGLRSWRAATSRLGVGERAVEAGVATFQERG